MLERGAECSFPTKIHPRNQKRLKNKHQFDLPKSTFWNCGIVRCHPYSRQLSYSMHCTETHLVIRYSASGLIASVTENAACSVQSVSCCEQSLAIDQSDVDFTTMVIYVRTAFPTRQCCCCCRWRSRCQRLQRLPQVPAFFPQLTRLLTMATHRQSPANPTRLLSFCVG